MYAPPEILASFDAADVLSEAFGDVLCAGLGSTHSLV